MASCLGPKRRGKRKSRPRGYWRRERRLGVDAFWERPPSISADTKATHTSPDKAPTNGIENWSSVSTATRNPTKASHLGRMPLPSTTSEAALTITASPTWQK